MKILVKKKKKNFWGMRPAEKPPQAQKLRNALQKIKKKKKKNVNPIA